MDYLIIQILVHVSLILCVFLSVLNGYFSRWTWVSWYQNVSMLDFIEAKDDGGGGDNCTIKKNQSPISTLLMHRYFAVSGGYNYLINTNVYGQRTKITYNHI